MKEKRWKTRLGSCKCCHKCRIYIEGPMKDKCIYGGPFTGYIDEEGNDLDININKEVSEK